ncbi:MAG TPA: family 43 glycosylhydrolase [Paenibacillus sp.]|uniref:family 43 glycosylhydrolase n=1 Tax=Paenibacillus sp. TaxID=58172 RepID=UPI0028D30A0A|nr:family 43 glycosylhydrolase [Paenibacillus sp.]HUC93083.1 family 43 glycosylhydrolase [Paenibacillus sp.]
MRCRRFAVLAAVILGAVIAGCSSGKEPSYRTSSYQNPVFEPVFADPSVIRADDGLFYAYGTEDDWGDGEGARLIPILKSEDLVTWSVAGEAFAEKPSWKDEGGLWAPDISRFNGKYYLYYSFSTWGDPNPGIGVAVADSPTGPFEDRGKLFDSEEIGVGNSIDPFLYMEGDTPYLFWGSFQGIYGIELGKDGFATAGEPFKIAGGSFEATYIVKRDGYYYFFGSLGSCCEGENSTYRVAVARARSLMGPYLDKAGTNIEVSDGTLVLAGEFMPDGPGKHFAGPGHNSIVQDDKGKDWIVYHAVDIGYPRLGNGAARRPLMIDPIEWKDGWPSIRDGLPSRDVRDDGPSMRLK